MECEKQFDTGSGSFSLSWRTKSPHTRTHKLAGRKHSRGGRGISGVCVEGWVGVTFQWIEEMKEIMVHIRSYIQKSDVWRGEQENNDSFHRETPPPLLLLLVSSLCLFMCVCVGCVHMLHTHI